MNSNSRLIIAILLFYSQCCCAKADLLEVYSNHVPPYTIIEKNEVSGISQQVFEALLSVSQLDAHYNNVNWARSYQQLTYEPNAVMLALSRRPERENLFHWIAKVGQITYQLWSKADQASNIIIHNKNELVNYTFVEVRGFNFPRFMRSVEGFTQSNLQLTTNKVRAINMLLKGRVDLMPGDSQILRWRFKELNLDFNSIQSVYQLNDSVEDLYIAISKNTPKHVLKRLRCAYEQLQKSGQLAEIKQQWREKIFTP